jgi:FMN reductase [NAD(P)H]
MMRGLKTSGPCSNSREGTACTGEEKKRRHYTDSSETIRKRQSLGAYQDKAGPEGIVEEIVEAGRWTPNAGAFHISVIKKTGLRQEISDLTRESMLHSGIEFTQKRASLPRYQPTYGAPVLMLLSAPADAPMGLVNVALAAENMLIEAASLGLGSCYLASPTRVLNGDENRELAKEAAVPLGYTVHCAVIAGYAAAENKFTLGKRKEKGEVTYVE